MVMRQLADLRRRILIKASISHMCNIDTHGLQFNQRGGEHTTHAGKFWLQFSFMKNIVIGTNDSLLEKFKTVSRRILLKV